MSLWKSETLQRTFFSSSANSFDFVISTKLKDLLHNLQEKKFFLKVRETLGLFNSVNVFLNKKGQQLKQRLIKLFQKKELWKKIGKSCQCVASFKKKQDEIKKFFGNLSTKEDYLW